MSKKGCVKPGSRHGLATLDAAATLLSSSRRHLYRLRDRGVLEFVYIGEGMPRVRESDLDRLVAEGVPHQDGRGAHQAVAG